MKNIKTKIIGMIAFAILFSAGILKADNNEPDTYSDLKNQIQKEMIVELKEHLYIKYQDKNLTGESVLTLMVEKNGKISVKSIVGENITLNSMIKDKFAETNLWTDTKFSGRIFAYTIVFKQ